MKYQVLLVLYVLLLLFHAWHYQQPTVPKWPMLEPATSATTTACLQTSDCETHHVCLQQVCFPKLLRGEECFKETGDWTLTAHQGRKFASCVCKNDQLVSQKVLGGNCDWIVACLPHGHFDVHTQQCKCPEGYVVQGYTCQKMTVAQAMQHYDCDSDEISFDRVQPSDGFDATYLAAGKKCFKRPCTFDALTGAPLKKARYQEGMGCVCDPTLGQFGVRLENMPYVRGPGYNACVSIFNKPLTRPIPVSIATYFYLMQRSPVVFLQYVGLNPTHVIAPLRELAKNGNLQIGQEFPYDYMQAFFREKQNYKTRTRNYAVNTYYMTQKQELWNVLPNQMEECRFISSHASFIKDKGLLKYKSLYQTAQERNWTWTLLYRFPACFIKSNDLEAPEKYRGTYVSNPFHMTLTRFPNDPRYNGLWLRYQPDEWFLDFAPSMDVDTYIQASNEQSVPFITNDVVNGIVDGTLTPARLLKHQEEVLTEQMPSGVSFLSP